MDEASRVYGGATGLKDVFAAKAREVLQFR